MISAPETLDPAPPAWAMTDADLLTELGARHTIELLSLRHRRDLRLARTISKHPTVEAALTNGPFRTTTNPPPGEEGVVHDLPGIHPGQADAIVSALELPPRMLRRRQSPRHPTTLGRPPPNPASRPPPWTS